MLQTSKDFDIFFKNDVVAVGWSRVDFTKFNSIEKLVREVERVYYSNGETAPQVAGKKKNEVRRFKSIKKGDKVIVPHWGSVCLAVAQEKEIYDEKAANIADLGNQRQVVYHRDRKGNTVFIPRDSLSEGLQRRIRVRGTTIADLQEFSSEINRLFQGEDFDVNFNRQRIQLMENFKAALLKKIQTGNTGLKTGGIGLENLVKELLELDGYKATIQAKHRFKGFADADIIAEKQDRLVPAKLLIQVKHHSGTTGTWGAEQLLQILNQNPDYFSDYRLVLVTTGSPSKELETICTNKDVILFSGEELIDWIFEMLPQLSFDTKKRLGVSDIPRLIN